MPIIEKALRTEEKGRSNLHEDAAGRFKIIGQTARMHKIYAMIEKVARSPTTALITGESGTGKELVARALHEHSTARVRHLFRSTAVPSPSRSSSPSSLDTRKARSPARSLQSLGSSSSLTGHPVPRRGWRAPERHAGQAPASSKTEV